MKGYKWPLRMDDGAEGVTTKTIQLNENGL